MFRRCSFSNSVSFKPPRLGSRTMLNRAITLTFWHPTCIWGTFQFQSSLSLFNYTASEGGEGLFSDVGFQVRYVYTRNRLTVSTLKNVVNAVNVKIWKLHADNFHESSGRIHKISIYYHRRISECVNGFSVEDKRRLSTLYFHRDTQNICWEWRSVILVTDAF